MLLLPVSVGFSRAGAASLLSLYLRWGHQDAGAREPTWQQGEVAHGTAHGSRGELAFSGCTLGGLARGCFAVGCPVCCGVLASTRGFQEHPHPENVSRVGQLIPGWGDTLHYIVFVQAPVTKFHRIRESAPTLSVFQVLQNRRPSGALSSLWQKCLSGRTTASNKDFCLGRRLRSVLSSSFGVLHIFQMSYKEKLHRV